MRRWASEKLEKLRLVEDSELSVRQTLAELQIHASTFYGWVRRYQEGGFPAPVDQKPVAEHLWNRIVDDVSENLLAYMLEHAEPLIHALAHAYTEKEQSFVSEARAMFGF